MDSSSKNNIDKLNKEISDVHKIMTENINLIVEREKIMENITIMSNELKFSSGEFKDKARYTRIRLMLAKYSIFLAIGAIIILFIVFKYYF